MEEWNKIRMAPPPHLTLAYSREEQEEEDIDECVESLTKSLSCLKEYLNREATHQSFYVDAKILRTLIKHNQRFKPEKFFGLLKKVCKCAEHLETVQLLPYVTKLQATMPDNSVKSGSVIHLPTRQMFEHLLTKILGTFKLLLTLESNCREATRYLMVKINIGHIYWMAMTFVATVARLRAISVDYAYQLGCIHDDILPWLQHLKGGTGSNLIGRNSTYLLEELKSHCKAVKEESKKQSKRNTSSVGSSVLDIFTDEAENSAVSLNVSFSDYGMKSNFQDQNSIKMKDDTKKRTEEPQALKAKTIGEEMIKSVGGSAVRGAKKRKNAVDHKAVNKKKSLKEKEDILSLLDILNDADESIEQTCRNVVDGVDLGRKHCKVGNRAVPKPNVAKSTVLWEDLGETVN